MADKDFKVTVTVLDHNEETGDALIYRGPKAVDKFVIAHGYDPEGKDWSHGSYFQNITDAVAEYKGVSIPEPEDTLLQFTVTRTDVEHGLDDAGYSACKENVDKVMENWHVSGFLHDDLSADLQESLPGRISQFADEMHGLEPKQPEANEVTVTDSRHYSVFSIDADMVQAMYPNLTAEQADEVAENAADNMTLAGSFEQAVWDQIATEVDNIKYGPEVNIMNVQAQAQDASDAMKRAAANQGEDAYGGDPGSER